jgi:hypothetical protein
MSTLKEELADIRRKLGPYVALQRDEAWRLHDAEIARALARLVDVVAELAAKAEAKER